MFHKEVPLVINTLQFCLLFTTDRITANNNVPMLFIVGIDISERQSSDK